MKPGDKVVCVNDVFRPVGERPNFTELPKKGRVYVIREVGVDDYDEAGVWLVGIYGDFHPSGREYGFSANRFRLLDELRAESAARSERKAGV